MKRHPFNVFSLVFGIVLILLAAWAAWVAFPRTRMVLRRPPMVAPRGGYPGRRGIDESLVHNDAEQENP